MSRWYFAPTNGQEIDAEMACRSVEIATENAIFGREFFSDYPEGSPGGPKAYRTHFAEPGTSIARAARSVAANNLKGPR